MDKQQTSLHDKLLKDGRKFFRVAKEAPYKNCWGHERKNQTRQGTIGMRIYGMLSGQTKNLYLCEDCFYKGVSEFHGQLRFNPAAV